MLEARRENCASQKLEPICEKYYYKGVCKFEKKISFKRKIALIFKLKTNIKRKKRYCSRKCLEEAGLLKVPEDEAGT